MRYWMILIFVIMLSGVFASDYSIVFNQVGDNLVVSENNVTNLVPDSGLDKTSSGYYFVKRIESKTNYTSFLVRLNLEEGMVAETGGIFPANYVFSSDGRVISLIWNYSNVSKGDVFAFFVSLEDKKSNASYTWLYGVIFVIILAVLIFFGFRYFKKRRDSGKYLLDEEKKVIQLLRRSEGGGMWQKNIQSSLGFYKAKLSRMVRNLESRGLIEKIPVGNTNKIKLK